MDDEVEEIWSKPSKLGSVLYFANRYGFLIYEILALFMYIPTITNEHLYRKEYNLQSFTGFKRCKIVTVFNGIFGIAYSLAPMCYFCLCTRVFFFALYKRRWYHCALLALFWLIPIGQLCVILVDTVYLMRYPLLPQKFHVGPYGCDFLPESSSEQQANELLLVNYVIFVVFDTIALAITFMARMTLAAENRGMPLTQTLAVLYDGSLYLLFVLLFGVIQAGVQLACVEIPSIALADTASVVPYCTQPIIAVLVNRLLLDFRLIYKSDNEGEKELESGEAGILHPIAFAQNESQGSSASDRFFQARAIIC